MNFKQFIEQGTVGGPLGGPGASGALGMSMSKMLNPGMSVSGSNSKPASKFSPGTKRPSGPTPGGAFGGGGPKGRYMKKKMKK